MFKQKTKINMKKNLVLFTMMLSAFFLFSSCKKNDPASGGAASAGNLAAGKCDIRFDYSGAVSGSFNSTLALSSAASSGAIYNISGSRVNGITPQITMILMAGIFSSNWSRTSLPFSV